MKYFIYLTRCGEVLKEVEVDAQAFFKVVSTYPAFEVNKDWLPCDDGSWILEFYHNDYCFGHMESKENPYGE